MKDIKDMKIGESFYLKMTVAVISWRTNEPCEYDEERIDVNALIIEELEKIKAEMEAIKEGYIRGIDYLDIIDEHISELKGETNGETTE